MGVIGIVIVVALIFFSACYQLSAWIWTLLIGGALILLSYFSFLPMLFTLIAGLIFLAVVCVVHLTLFRRRYILNPSLHWLKNQLPHISDTEKAAIEAGDTWWEKELFSGCPNWRTLFTMPKPALTEEETSFLNNQVETICAMLNDWQIVDELRDMPEEVWAYFKKETFFGLVIPKKFGGRGFSALAHSTIVMKLATRSLSAAVNIMVPNSLGPAELILHYGTEEQKSHYLPRLASGTDIPCFALTAPHAGSDAGAIPDVGIVCKQIVNGQETLGITLNFDKRYITLAPVATLLGVAFHLYDPDKLLGEKIDIGITLCLIAANHPGVEIGNRHYPLRLAFMNGPVRGKDVFLPLSAIIGGQAMAGQGWRMLMECLSVGRSISLPALATSCGKSAFRFTGAYAKIRRQFNTSLSSFEGVQEALGTIAGKMYLLEATRLFTVGAVDQHLKPSIASAIAKYHMTEMSRDVIACAMDVHGGHAIQMGPRNVIGNAHVAIPISITVEGANILTRNLIIFGQGAIRCHPFLLQEVMLLSEDKTNIDALDRVLLSHVGRFVSLVLRNLFYGLTGGRFILVEKTHRQLTSYQKQLTRMSAALALFSDVSLMLLGGKLKRMERLSARLGDVLSELYLASAVMKYFSDHGAPLSDVPYVKWCLQSVLTRIETTLNDICYNYPNKFVGKLLGWLVFPLGKAYAYPRDRLNQEVVKAMITPSDFRNRLSEYCYVSQSKTDVTAVIEKVLSQCEQIDPLRKKCQQAENEGKIASYFTRAEKIEAAKTQHILSEEEARLLHEYERACDEVIKVNEFSFNMKEVIA